MASALCGDAAGTPRVVDAMAGGLPFPAPDYLPWRVTRLRRLEVGPTTVLVRATAPRSVLGRGGVRAPWPAGHPRAWTIAMTLVRPSALGDADLQRLAAELHAAQARAVDQGRRLYRRAVEEHGSLPAACAHLPAVVADEIALATARRDRLAALLAARDVAAMRQRAPAYLLRALLRQRRRGAEVDTWRWLLPLAATGHVITGARGDLFGPYAGPPEGIPLSVLPEAPRAYAALSLGLERFLQHALLAL